MGTGCKAAGILTTHLHIVPRLRMRGAIPPLQHAFMAWCPVKAQGQLYLYLQKVREVTVLQQLLSSPGGIATRNFDIIPESLKSVYIFTTASMRNILGRMITRKYKVILQTFMTYHVTGTHIRFPKCRHTHLYFCFFKTVLGTFKMEVTWRILNGISW
jgi:hypothetical protein